MAELERRRRPPPQLQHSPYVRDQSNSPGMTKTPQTSPPKRPMGRARSNSRSSGSRSNADIDQYTISTDLDSLPTASPPPLVHQVSQQQQLSPILANKTQTPFENRTQNQNDNAIDSSSAEQVTIPPPASDELSKFQNDLTETLSGTTSPNNRKKHTHIIILKSLNATFETKFLVVPFKPDGLKLGRPVTNNLNKNSASKRDLYSQQVRPDNGNFDSRVLSRNHACLSCDHTTGKIYIRDLKSSNGTFVNGVKIDQNDVVLKVGDTVDLGTDIDTKFEHRKISAYVEEISVIPLMNTVPDAMSLITKKPEFTNKNETNSTDINGIKLDREQHSQHIPLRSHLNENYTEAGVTSATTAQRAAFEAAMFGDVNNIELDDEILGVETEVLSGIFINNSAGTSMNLINMIKTLTTELSLERQEMEKLHSMQNFMTNYTANLDSIKKHMVDMNEKHLLKLSTALKKTLSENNDALLKESEDQLREIKQQNNKIKSACSLKEKNDRETLQELEKELTNLNLQMDQERQKNSTLTQSNSSNNITIENMTRTKQDDPKENKKDSEETLVSTEEVVITGENKSKLSKGILFGVVAISFGLVATAFKQLPQ
ncbi:vps64p [Saccharomyces arboricola H-6]|uniref:Vps64p n=1 Tax=Saccharomyces arboricola (strain H-6 / AS 2.3317 / CBS 10644) TaxID=1160507 RepID=J8PYC1_SACAR|nr:vps64p [Saccharomyces arboricola H-6]